MSGVTLAAIKIGSIMLGLDPWQTVLSAGLITVVFSAIGGFKGVVYTDFLLFFTFKIFHISHISLFYVFSYSIYFFNMCLDFMYFNEFLHKCTYLYILIVNIHSIYFKSLFITFNIIFVRCNYL